MFIICIKHDSNFDEIQGNTFNDLLAIYFNTDKRSEKVEERKKIDFIFLRRIRRGLNRGSRANGSVRGRGSHVVTDARFKIIQKNREKLTDARDKLAEIAKQSDARLKLDKIRASQFKKMDVQLSGISRKTGRNGRLSLSTNKVPPLMPHVLPPNIPAPTRVVGYRPPSLSEPHYLGDMSMDYTDGM